MERINLSKVIGEPGGNVAGGKVFEEFLSLELVEDALGLGLDGEGATKEVVLGDVDGADLAGPSVDVLEEVGVDFLEVSEVELALDGGIEELLVAQNGEVSFFFA